MRSKLVRLFRAWLLFTLGAGWPCFGSDAPPSCPPPESGKSFLVVVDRATYADPALQARLARYLQNVESLFGMTGRVAQVASFDDREPGGDIAALRETLKESYRQEHIAGAILLGRIPFMVWRQAAGCTWVNYGTEDFYFADLDAEFLDQESRYGGQNGDVRKPADAQNLDNQLIPGRERQPDRQFDTYQRGRQEGPEIWIARMFAPTAAQYVAYFDRVNAYYDDIRQRLAADPGAAVTPCTDILYAGHPQFAPHPDAGKYRFFQDFSRSLPGSQFVVPGEKTGATVAEYFSHYNGRAWLWASVDGHADMETHFLKDGAYTTRDLSAALTPGRGALIQQIWGCHGNDFLCNRQGAMNLSQAYVTGAGICQAAYESSWTSGTEDTEVEILAAMARGDYLGRAFQNMQTRLYAREHMAKFFASELKHLNWFVPPDVPEEKRMDVLVTKLLRGYNLMGNPFLKITYTNTRK